MRWKKPVPNDTRVFRRFALKPIMDPETLTYYWLEWVVIKQEFGGPISFEPGTYYYRMWLDTSMGREQIILKYQHLVGWHTVKVLPYHERPHLLP